MRSVSSPLRRGRTDGARRHLAGSLGDLGMKKPGPRGAGWYMPALYPTFPPSVIFRRDGSPSHWARVLARWVRQLMILEVCSGQLPPPVVPSSNCGLSPQSTGELVPGRIDQADRHSLASFLDGEAKIAVVGDHQCAIDCACQNIQKEMRRNVDVRPLLLAVGVRDHKTGIRDLSAVAILDHYGPLRAH